MRFSLRLAALAATITAGLGPAVISLGSVTLASPRPGTASAAAGGTRLWAARYSQNGASFATSVAVSPDRSRVFAAGGPVVAYNAAAGTRLWVAPVPGGSGNHLAVSPDSATVFVTGYSTEASGIREYGTSAYDAATGAPLWTASYHGPGAGDDVANAIAVSPDGSTVFVTGQSSNTTAAGGAPGAYATVAYDAATGAQLWVARYADHGMNADAFSVAASSDSSTVYVTGGSAALVSGRLVYAAATVAYDAASGAQVWLDRYMANGSADGQGIAVSPDGSKVLVAGTAHVRRNDAHLQDYVTLAYNPGTGARLWTTLYPAQHSNPAIKNLSAMSMALSQDGTELAVTGQMVINGTASYGTVAYDAANGAPLWARHLARNGFATATSVAISPDGSEVFVTGFANGPVQFTSNYLTVAYNAATGATRWTRIYNGGTIGESQATAVAVSPGGSAVFVTGGPGFGTVAYSP
jgi:WD40 repeat protein